MASTWLETLGRLTGEEIYELANVLDHHIALVEQAPRARRLTEARVQELNRLVLDLIELRQEVLIQIARITVPLADAQAIVYRALFARNRPVRVVPA